MNQLAQKLWKPLLALAVVGFAFTITFVSDEGNGLDFDLDGSPTAQAARGQDPYDLTQLQVLNRAILEVNDHYVEPQRIDHRRMLLAGSNAIQRSVAPVIVRYEEDASDLTVQVNDRTATFRLDDVESPWKLANRFREIFRFLQANLGDEEVERIDDGHVRHQVDRHREAFALLR